MTSKQAIEALQDAEVVPCVEGAISEAKEILALCLGAEIPALLGKERCDKPDCSPKVQVLVRADDAPRVGALLRQRWEAMLASEGVALRPLELPAEGDLPCPACMTAAPLVEGACSDCGLQLE